jgi:uroporphyrinogen decarboxylase
MKGAERFLAAARRQPVDCTPVWFMRQAGRCLADYRELRKRYDILTLAKTPELSARVTLMPVEAFGVDAAVMFADIMLPLEPMGVSLEIEPELGPIIHNPIASMADVERLRVVDPREGVPYVLEAVRRVAAELADGRAGVIGFAGSPYTLACYLIESRPSRDYALAKSLMLAKPDVWAALMEKLTEQMIAYLRAQVEAGAQVVQLFDSWIGGLSPLDYERSVLPWAKRIFAALKGAGAPTIYFGTGNAHLLELMASAGSDLMSLDWRVNLDEGWARVGHDRGVQGNLDPVRPLAGWGPTEEGMRDVLRRAGGRGGHIFNLGHGVLKDTDPAILRRLVEAVHAESRR